ncbi:MAG: DUF2007 domain-containing protein [Pseudomonadota bacterium]
MIELFRTNDMVLLSAAEALLKEFDIIYFIADEHMSVLEGSIGVLPRRLMVDAESKAQAERVLEDAGIMPV